MFIGQGCLTGKKLLHCHPEAQVQAAGLLIDKYLISLNTSCFLVKRQEVFQKFEEKRKIFL
jgi:hypothetical protein